MCVPPNRDWHALLIERAIVIALAPIWAEMREHRQFIKGQKLALDALALRVEFVEENQSAIEIATSLKADIVGLPRDVDEVKSTELLLLFCMVEIPEVPTKIF